MPIPSKKELKDLQDLGRRVDASELAKKEGLRAQFTLEAFDMKNPDGAKKIWLTDVSEFVTNSIFRFSMEVFSEGIRRGLEALLQRKAPSKEEVKDIREQMKLDLQSTKQKSGD